MVVNSLRGRLLVGCICIVLTTAFSNQPARADDVGRALFGLFGNIVTQGIARESWSKIDMNTRNCLLGRYGISAERMIQQGISAQNSRITPYVQECRAIALRQWQSRKYEQEAARERQEAIEQQRARQEAMAKARAAEQARAREEEARQAEERRKELVSVHGARIAEHILAHRAVVGMTREQVRLSRGKPARMEKIPPDDELWHYRDGAVSFFKGKAAYVE